MSGQFVMDEPKISEESEATVKGKDGILRGVPNEYVSDEDLHDDEETGLTAKERKRKQRKKRRNTLLDQRIARDNVTVEEQKEADQTVARRLAVNGTLIGLWYLFSLCISLVSLHASINFSRGTVFTDSTHSTTSGCLTHKNSTFHFLYSQRLFTCLCNFL